VVTQREIGVDVPTFKEALRRALRQDPDVILVGEMRDWRRWRRRSRRRRRGIWCSRRCTRPGPRARWTASWMRSRPTSRSRSARSWPTSIVAVISQILMPRKDKPGRVAAFEIMIATPSIRSLIRDNKTFRITSDLQTGAKWGMQTLDSHLLDLWREGKIAYEELVTKAQDTEEVMQQIRSKQ
jgi:twitching motility protein PilT